jgi:hypothetical protein
MHKAEIRRIEIQSQPGQIVLEKAHPKNRTGAVAEGIGPEFKPSTAQKEKKQKNKKTLLQKECVPGNPFLHFFQIVFYSNKFSHHISTDTCGPVGSGTNLVLPLHYKEVLTVKSNTTPDKELLLEHYEGHRRAPCILSGTL